MHGSNINPTTVIITDTNRRAHQSPHDITIVLYCLFLALILIFFSFSQIALEQHSSLNMDMLPFSATIKCSMVLRNMQPMNPFDSKE